MCVVFGMFEAYELVGVVPVKVRHVNKHGQKHRNVEFGVFEMISIFWRKDQICKSRYDEDYHRIFA